MIAPRRAAARAGRAGSIPQVDSEDETGWADTVAPGNDDIAALAEAAREALPAGFLSAAREVAIRVEDFADPAMLSDVGLEDAFELTGLYDGIPLTERSVMDQPDRPDTIWLFRRPILDEWADRGDVALGRLVAHVYVHELAHHLGWSDDDIAAIDRWWE
jgi:predicted Zn-dependent protease with MMP-like domain